jgi:hypothetical protein
MIKVELAGGLGNQLFGYFAGLTFTNLRNTNLQLDGSSIDLVRTEYDLSSFNIRSEIDYSRNRTLLNRLIRKGEEILDHRFHSLTTFSRNLLGTYIDSGYEENLIALANSGNKNINFRGYFQDPRYFLNLPEEIRKLELVAPSNWFKGLSIELKNSETTIIHLRFGDFLENIASIGVLGSKYFFNALDQISVSPNNPIWVFSDDIPRARILLGNQRNRTFRYVENSSITDPAESMVLISLGRNIITANSTFSVWSGLLSGKGTKVVVPGVFHRGSGHKIDNLPSSWHVVPSSWASEYELSYKNV